MIHFITFGDGSLGIRHAARRLAKSALKSNLFSTVRKYDLKMINSSVTNFRGSHREFIDRHPPGLGHFIWKPSLILGAMKDLQEGDILVYLDAGCQFNFNTFSINRFEEYLEIVMKHDGLFMQLRSGSLGIQDLTEKSWTDPEVLSFFDLTIEESNSNQVQAGIILLKKGHESLAFLQKWEELCSVSGYSLLAPSCDPARPHRAEQSILSILVKRSSFKFLPDETFFYPNWKDGLAFPIWAMRNRTGANAFRRNFWDLFLLSFARLERNLKTVLFIDSHRCPQPAK